MARPFDTVALPPEFMAALKARFDDQVPMRFMGMRVIESPLAYRTRRVAERLQRSRTAPYGHYELTYKEVREPVALMFNTKALGFEWPLPPIFKRDLSAFQDSDMGIVSILTAAAG